MEDYYKKQKKISENYQIFNPATANLKFFPSLQSYISGGTNTQYVRSATVRFDTDQIIGYYLNTDTYQNLFDFTAGTLTSAQDITSIGVGGSVDGIEGEIDNSGHLWLPNGTGNEIAVIDMTTSPWTVVNTIVGGSGTDFVSSCHAGSGTNEYIAFGYLLGGNVNIWSVSSQSFIGSVLSTGATTNVCYGPSTSSSATIFFTSHPFGIFGSDYSFYRVDITNNIIKSTLLASYTPNIFVLGGSSFGTFSCPIYDQTDGNVLIQVEVDSKAYIAKLDTTTGAILWITQVLNTDGFQEQAPSKSIISDSQYLMYCQNGVFSGRLHIINTTNGALLTKDFTGFLGIGNQVSNDLLGSITGNVGWDTTHGPIYLLNQTSDSGSTMGTVYFVPPAIPLPSVVEAFSFAILKDTTYNDWRSTGLPQDFVSYMQSYFYYASTVSLFLESPYIFTYLELPDTGTPSCILQPIWDWCYDPSSPKFGEPSECYVGRLDQAVSDRRHRVRGKGRALQLLFTSSSGQPFSVLGWGIRVDENFQP